jgi:hypothetical protein
MHNYHDALPGFDERQIWFDGCAECEWRGKNVVDSLGSLDRERFARAWKRAADWNRDVEIGPVSKAERPLLHVLWRFQVALQQQIGLDIGELPKVTCIL